MKPYRAHASDALEWTKSSYSSNVSNCVEVASLPTGDRALRDSKNPHGPALTVTTTPYATFVRGVASGAFPEA
ncbi:DUF397 domain-containing protein [Streptomyces albidoflavus]